MKELGSRRNDLYGNELKGAHAINLERVTDERGFFARRWCAKEFLSHGLSPAIVQVNIGHSANKRGTIRGMHSQYAEVKVVYCSRGALYNVIVDLRDGPSAKGLWVGAELTADNGRVLYVPEGFAYGYQTLERMRRIWSIKPRSSMPRKRRKMCGTTIRRSKLPGHCPRVLFQSRMQTGLITERK